MAPIWIVLVLGLIFCAGRALETPSVQNAQRRLGHALDNYETLTENITDIIARSDLNGVYQYVSPACFSILGYNPDELIGRPRMEIVDPASAVIVRDALTRMIADSARTEVLTVRLRHKAGHWVWVQSSAKLVCQDGVPVGVIDVARDVSVQVETAIALDEARQAAEAACPRKGRVSHKHQP